MSAPSSSNNDSRAEKQISQLYQNSATTEPARHIDEAILNAAKEEVTRQHAGSSSQRSKWYIPMTLAAGLLIAVAAIKVYSPGTDSQSEQIAKNGTLTSAAGKSSPEQMLDKIAALLQDSKHKKAQEQYAAFRVLFPYYQIDYERYPTLKSLADESEKK